MDSAYDKSHDDVCPSLTVYCRKKVRCDWIDNVDDCGTGEKNNDLAEDDE